MKRKNNINEIIDKYLNEGKMSNEEVGSYISSEGLEYAIQSGISVNNIEDKKLARMWKQAEKSINDIVNYLGDYIFEM